MVQKNLVFWLNSKTSTEQIAPSAGCQTGQLKNRHLPGFALIFILRWSLLLVFVGSCQFLSNSYLTKKNLSENLIWIILYKFEKSDS